MVTNILRESDWLDMMTHEHYFVPEHFDSEDTLDIKVRGIP